MKLRFSIATLLTTVLLVASGVALWLNAAPWYLRWEVSETYGSQMKSIAFSSDGRWFLHLAYHTGIDVSEWVLSDIDARTQQRWNANAGIPRDIPASLNAPDLIYEIWHVNDDPTKFRGYLYHLRANRAESLPKHAVTSLYPDMLLIAPLDRDARLIDLKKSTERIIHFDSAFYPLARCEDFAAANRLLNGTRLYDLQSGKFIAEVKMSERSNLYFSHKWLAVENEEQTSIHRLNDGKLVGRAEQSHYGLFSQDERWVAVQTLDSLSVYQLTPTFRKAWSRTFPGLLVISPVEVTQIEGLEGLVLQYDEEAEKRTPWTSRPRPFKTSLEVLDWSSGRVLYALRSMDLDADATYSKYSNGVLVMPLSQPDDSRLIWDLKAGTSRVVPHAWFIESPDKRRRIYNRERIGDPPARVTDETGAVLWHFPSTVYLENTRLSSNGQRLLNDPSGLGSRQFWERRRDERLWGLAQLPEFWAFTAFALLWLWNLRRAYRTRFGTSS